MNYRKLGRTGMLVSEIGFGCIPILKGSVQILPHYYNLSERDAVSVMESAFDRGCNLYDTAIVPEYGDAEIKVGKFLQRHKGEIYVSDKARSYTGDEMQKSVMQSLKNLGSDYCDIYFVHQAAPENEDAVYAPGGALDVLDWLKQKGYIGAAGIGTHHYSVAYRAALDDRVDVIQIPGNVLERGILDRIEHHMDVFDRVGILVHKAYAAGVLTDYFPPGDLLDFSLGYPVAGTLVGMGSVGHVIAATNRDGNPKRIPMYTVEKKLGEIYNMIPCTRCQKCTCKSGIEIESVFRYYNYYHLGHGRWAYNRLAKAADKTEQCCRACSRPVCEACCPQNIHIREKLLYICQWFKGGRGMEEKNLKPGKDYIGVGVGAVILKDGKILLLLRKKAPEAGCWTIPGGKVEFGETVEDAVLREVKEEINAEGKIIAPLGVTNHILKEEGIHYVSPRFLVELLEEPQNMEPDSHELMEWFPVENLPENVTMTTRKALSAFLTWNMQNLKKDGTGCG